MSERWVHATPAEWSIRYIREGDEEGILDLLQAAFGRWPAVEISVPPLDHLRWKLHNHPLAYSYHVVAEAGARIIGVRIMFVYRAKLGDETCLIYYGMDNAVHPEFHNRGVMTAMRSFRLDDFRRQFSFKLGSETGNPALRRIKDRAGERLFGAEMRTFVQSIEPGTAGEASPAPDAGCVLREVSSFDGWLTELYEQAARPFQLIIVRDEALLRWRYGDARAGRFVVKVAERDGRALGYVVLRVSHGRGYLADLLTVPDRPDVVRSLVGDALRTFREANVASVECLLPANHPYVDVLGALGFRARRRRPHFSFIPMSLAEEQLALLGDPNTTTHLVLGDFDLV